MSRRLSKAPRWRYYQAEQADLVYEDIEAVIDGIAAVLSLLDNIDPKLILLR